MKINENLVEMLLKTNHFEVVGQLDMYGNGKILEVNTVDRFYLEKSNYQGTSTHNVVYDKTSAWQAVFDWFLQRGNVSTYFNIGGNVYRLRKDERGFYNFEQQAGEYWGGNLFNRTKRGWLKK